MTYKFMWVGFDGFVDANVIGLSTKEEVKLNFPQHITYGALIKI